jgi:hypothetical protein
VAGQLGNTQNASIPANSVVIDNGTGETFAQAVAVDDAANGAAPPVRQLDQTTLRNLGQKYKSMFDRFASERLIAEQKWIRNLRQYLGIYDPETERLLPRNRSRAYPRLTRMKCISMLSRLMNLMFPGNEDNWEVNCSPSPEMSPESVAQAVQDLMTRLQSEGQQVALTQELVDEAVRALAEKNAAKLTNLLKDQLQELGGNQTKDWISLNRKVVDGGVKYGIGVLEGPFVRAIQTSGWTLQGEGAPGPDGKPTAGGFKPVERTIYKPQYDHLVCWDFYPDMSARELPGEGYFVRKVLGRSALRKLADRPDFFGAQIKNLLVQMPQGNFKPRSWETELKTMGTAINAETVSATAGREKYEVIIWKGPVSAQTLVEAGAEVPDNMRSDDVEAELWMVDNWVIKAEVNAWRKLGLMMQQVHIFNFDEDDTSPIGNGLPSIVRDSQLSVCAATRMALDNASVTCGPNLEVNTALMRADQDLTSVEPYKIWYRDDDGPSSQFPAVRRIEIDGHLQELQSLVKMFLEFAEMETFIGPSTGGDMTQMPSEPMRTAAGASMARGDAALPFKDIVRNYDSFTQSVIWSLIGFNRKFNPDEAPEGDYDAIPRGATSLIAKEVRGMQIDVLSQTLTPDERDHLDERKFIEAKFAARDLAGMLVSADEARRRQDGRAQLAAADKAKQTEMLEAQIKKLLAEAFKGVAQGQKNAAGADKTSVETALSMIDTGADDGQQGAGGGANKAGS